MPPDTVVSGDQAISNLVEAIWRQHEATSPTKRVLVSISGIPGAGKSTLAQVLSERLNKIFLERHDGTTTTTYQFQGEVPTPTSDAFAVNIPMDGFHLSRAELWAMPDPETAIHRRGAAFTFDATGYCRLVQQLAEPVDAVTSPVFAPTFDHATKDPVANGVRIGRGTQIAILEGNYVNLDREPWSLAAKLFDIKIAVAVDRNVAKQRLLKRHVSSGICVDEASARYRVESTDDLNAEDILRNVVLGVLSITL